MGLLGGWLCVFLVEPNQFPLGAFYRTGFAIIFYNSAQPQQATWLWFVLCQIGHPLNDHYGGNTVLLNFLQLDLIKITILLALNALLTWTKYHPYYNRIKFHPKSPLKRFPEYATINSLCSTIFPHRLLLGSRYSQPSIGKSCYAESFRATESNWTTTSASSYINRMLGKGR